MSRVTARMLSKLRLFLLLILLELVSSDRLRFHLENLVDRNVSACDDFYHHVCSQNVDPNEFFINRVATIFRNATKRLRPDAVLNSPIEHDLDFVRKTEDTLEDNKYESYARDRCKDDVECYMHDQIFYASRMIEIELLPNLTVISEEDSLEVIIDNLITRVSMRFFSGLQTRIHMIEFMKSNKTFSDLHEIVDIGEILKKRMIEKIERSKWLHGHEMSDYIREKIKERIGSIEIMHDFDELDKNITMLQKLNRDFNHLYFSNQRATGVRGIDVIFKIKEAFDILNSTSSPKMSDFLSRIADNFELNAFFNSNSKMLTMFAPFIYRPVFETDIFKEPIITYHTLGHELYHSLFSPDSPVLLALYGHRRECVIDHYKQTCTKFGMGSCMSGNQTITEDASDLESYRMIYDFVQEKYGAQKLKKKIDGMEITLVQAFFYYAGSAWCEEDMERPQEDAERDPHSNLNIRINAAYSLMPEFTNAFGCQKGDAMYMEEKDSCYLLLFLFLLELVSSDRLRFHLENLVDRNVPACDDFYHHVCSQKANPDEFFINRVALFFKNATDRLRPNAVINSPIEHDLDLARKNEDKLEDNKYEAYARERCKDDIKCYIDDQHFYSSRMSEIEILHNFTNISKEESLEVTISNIIADTSAMIDEMIPLLMENRDESIFMHTDAMQVFAGLQTRIHMIEFMKSNETFGDFHEIIKIGETLKKRMVENIEKSKWLHGHEMSDFIRQKMKERIDSIEIMHDFDDLDKNITMLQKLNREFNQFYFSTNRPTGVRGLDIFFKIQEAFKILNSTSSPKMRDFMERIAGNFKFNAFFSNESKMVTIYAPLMYRPASQSTIIEDPIITYYILGHELYHSLFSRSSQVLLSMYGHRRECVINHYNQTCTKFGMGSCMSGNQTITEDASDLESFRLIYDFVQEKHGAEQLKQTIDGMETTLDQVFFYYAGSTWCEEDIERSQLETEGNPHSNKNIRINAAFSLMPEFTTAFGCQKGDAMYMEEKDSCYIFGPNS